MKVLICDDSAVVRALHKRVIEPYGAVITEATNGIEAVDLFNQTIHNNDRFDLILMDLRMPEMDGQEALKKIRMIENSVRAFSLTHSNRVIIIMLTAVDDPMHLVEAYTRGGCNGYVLKSEDPSELLGKLKKFNLIG